MSALFEGSFTPAALAVVWESEDALDRVEVLPDQSFVQRLETHGKMLQPLRELAAAHGAHNPLVEAWLDRHACYFLGRIEEYIGEWQRSDTDDRASCLPHYPNIWAGMVWVTEQGQVDLAYRYLCMVGFFWSPFGLAGRELPLIDQVLTLPAPADRPTLLRALEVSTYGLRACEKFQDLEARLEVMLTICQGLGDQDTATMASLSLADVELKTGRTAQAWKRVEQVLQEKPARMSGGFQTPRARMNWPNVCRAAAYCLLELGRYEEATLARQYYREVGNRSEGLQTEHLMGQLTLHLNRRAEGTGHRLDTTQLDGGCRAGRAAQLHAGQSASSEYQCQQFSEETARRAGCL